MSIKSVDSVKGRNVKGVGRRIDFAVVAALSVWTGQRKVVFIGLICPQETPSSLSGHSEHLLMTSLFCLFLLLFFP